MFYAVMIIVINSILPTIPSAVYIRTTQADFYSKIQCQEFLLSFRQDTTQWFKEYNKGGIITGKCYKLKGAHRA